MRHGRGCSGRRQFLDVLKDPILTMETFITAFLPATVAQQLWRNPKGTKSKEQIENLGTDKKRFRANLGWRSKASVFITVTGGMGLQEWVKKTLVKSDPKISMPPRRPKKKVGARSLESRGRPRCSRHPQHPGGVGAQTKINKKNGLVRVGRVERHAGNAVMIAPLIAKVGFPL